jgi:hypothetical protein
MTIIKKSKTKSVTRSQALLNIGFGGAVVADRVVAIVSPNSAPMKRIKDEARDDRRLVDATHGRKTRSIIVMDSNHIVLSAIQAETISQRYILVMKDSRGKDEGKDEQVIE